MGEVINLTHSFSSLKMYENCPKRYYHQRITKEVVDSGSEATRYGNRVHKALEERLDSDSPLSEEAIKYEDMCATLQNVKKRPHFQELLLEQQLCLTDERMATGWWDANAWLRSIIDVLILFKGSAIVVDWKTGKRRPDFTQLEMFAVQVFSHYPKINKVHTSFVWLKEDKQDTKTFYRAELPEMWESIQGRIDRITQSVRHDDFPAKPSGLCRWCPCYDFCEYAS